MAEHEHEWVAQSGTTNDDGSYSITYRCECGATTETFTAAKTVDQGGSPDAA